MLNSHAFKKQRSSTVFNVRSQCFVTDRTFLPVDFPFVPRYSIHSLLIFVLGDNQQV